MSSLMMTLQRILLTYLMRFFMMTIDDFSDVEAGAHFIDLPYAFPHYNIV
jgi:hypothetical protein